MYNRKLNFEAPDPNLGQILLPHCRLACIVHGHAVACYPTARLVTPPVPECRRWALRMAISRSQHAHLRSLLRIRSTGSRVSLGPPGDNHHRLGRDVVHRGGQTAGCGHRLSCSVGGTDRSGYISGDDEQETQETAGRFSKEPAKEVAAAARNASPARCRTRRCGSYVGRAAHRRADQRER